MADTPRLLEQLFDRIQANDLKFPANDEISQPWKDVIVRILGSKELEDRPSLEELLDMEWIEDLI